jgi:hypothetical protein
LTNAETVQKIRQHARAIIYLCDESLHSESFGDASPSLEGIVWHPTTGKRTRQPFERSDDFANPNHMRLVQQLQQHGDFMQIAGFNVWLLYNGKSVARRPINQ